MEGDGSMRPQGLMAALWLVAAATPARAQHPDTTTQPLQITLPDAVQRALQVQPSMVTAEGNVRNADASRLAANGGVLPSLGLSGGSNRSGGSLLTGNQISQQKWQTTFSTALSASIDLFTGFRRLAARSAAGASQDAADAGLINQRYQTTLLTKQAFYNALADEELLRVAVRQPARTRQELLVGQSVIERLLREQRGLIALVDEPRVRGIL